MTTEDLLSIIKERGLSLYVKNGAPVVYAENPVNNREITAKLLRVVNHKYHRERIIDILSKEAQ